MRWDPDGRIVDLGLLDGLFPTAGRDVDADGRVVGSIDVDLIGDVKHAALFEGGAVIDLNTLLPPGSDWELSDARGINGRGEIAGTGFRDGLPRLPMRCPSADRLVAGRRSPTKAVPSFLLRPDCDGSGVADADEIAAGQVPDANGNDVPDGCETCQTDLGFGGPGAIGLSLCGDPLDDPANVASLVLTGVAPGATLFVVLDTSADPTPVKGGTLVPSPPIVVTGLDAGDDGMLTLTVSGLAGPRAPVFVQAVSQLDEDFAFSSAIEAVFGS